MRVTFQHLLLHCICFSHSGKHCGVKYRPSVFVLEDPLSIYVYSVWLIKYDHNYTYQPATLGGRHVVHTVAAIDR